MSSKSQENTSLFKEITRLVTRNFWLKVLSFLFAGIIFFIVRTDKEIIFERTAKIKLITSPDMVVLGEKERLVDVTIKQQNSFFAIPPSDIELTGEIDVLNENPGNVRVKVTKDNFPNLSKQYVIFMDRPFINIDIDKLQEKTVPVQVVLQGEPKKGFIVEKVTVSPERIKLTGAKQDLAHIKNILTVPVDISGIDTSLKTNVIIDLDPSTTITTKEKIVLVTIMLKSEPAQMDVRRL